LHLTLETKEVEGGERGEGSRRLEGEVAQTINKYKNNFKRRKKYLHL
jgi:hypothetical protein